MSTEFVIFISQLSASINLYIHMFLWNYTKIIQTKLGHNYHRGILLSNRVRWSRLSTSIGNIAKIWECRILLKLVSMVFKNCNSKREFLKENILATFLIPFHWRLFFFFWDKLRVKSADLTDSPEITLF